MNGPEHYREAEELLGQWANGKGSELLAAAHVHATLAVAAASVQYLADGHPETLGARVWRKVLRDGSDPR